MDSEAAGESERPREENLAERILKEHQVLDLNIGKGIKIEAGDQFFGIAQPIIQDGKLVEPMCGIIPRGILESYMDKKGMTYGVFELLKKGKIGLVDLKGLPPNISLHDFGFGRYRFKITEVLEEKIEKIGHVFCARVLSEEKTGVKHTHYKKEVKFLTEVPEKFRKIWLTAKKPGTDDVYYVLRGNDEIEWKGIERGDSFNATLTNYNGSGKHDFEIKQFNEFGYIGHVKPEDKNHEFKTNFDYKMLRTNLVYRFVTVHVMPPGERLLRKFYCIPLHLVKGIDAAYARYEPAKPCFFR
ncbi:hypothetical protein HYU07_03130 [Candidatus Woesearchaeota archaeon]|nr:hypothetical protein [Candidatus Woesearchaeota archaeon]